MDTGRVVAAIISALSALLVSLARRSGLSARVREVEQYDKRPAVLTSLLASHRDAFCSDEIQAIKRDVKFIGRKMLTSSPRLEEERIALWKLRVWWKRLLAVPRPESATGLFCSVMAPVGLARAHKPNEGVRERLPRRQLRRREHGRRRPARRGRGCGRPLTAGRSRTIGCSRTIAVVKRPMRPGRPRGTWTRPGAALSSIFLDDPPAPATSSWRTGAAATVTATWPSRRAAARPASAPVPWCFSSLSGPGRTAAGRGRAASLRTAPT